MDRWPLRRRLYKIFGRVFSERCVCFDTLLPGLSPTSSRHREPPRPGCLSWPHCGLRPSADIGGRRWFWVAGAGGRGLDLYKAAPLTGSTCCLG